MFKLIVTVLFFIATVPLAQAEVNTDKFYNFQQCKAIAVESRATIWDGPLAMNVSLLPVAIENSDKNSLSLPSYRRMDKAAKSWGFDEKKWKDSITESIKALNGLTTAYHHSGAFYKIADLNIDPLEKCAVLIELDIELGNLNRLELNYGIGRTYYMHDDQGTLKLIPNKELPKFIPNKQGTRTVYVANDKTKAQIKTLTENLLDQIKKGLQR